VAVCQSFGYVFGAILVLSAVVRGRRIVLLRIREFYTWQEFLWCFPCTPRRKVSNHQSGHNQNQTTTHDPAHLLRVCGRHLLILFLLGNNLQMFGDNWDDRLTTIILAGWV